MVQRKQIDKVALAYALIAEAIGRAFLPEAIEKLEEVIVAPHGIEGEADEVVVRGDYFDVIEDMRDDGGEVDTALEWLGMELKRYGIRKTEGWYELDEQTGKLTNRE